jgi:hypothetical protein
MSISLGAKDVEKNFTRTRGTEESSEEYAKLDSLVNLRSAIATAKTTVTQNVTPPKSLCTSCVKSKLSKNE